MCAVFPTEVSCTIPNVGAAGAEQVILELLELIFKIWEPITFLELKYGSFKGTVSVIVSVPPR